MKLTILQGDIFQRIKEIPDESIDLVLTSPPYWAQRNYGVEGQLGAEPSMEAYLENMMRWVNETWRVLKPTGSFVLNLGDVFGRYKLEANGLNETVEEDDRGSIPLPKGRLYKAKQLISVSSFAYCRIVSETDFVCRGEHIWAKPNVPSSIRGRLKHSHEKLFWFVKDADKYYFNKTAWMKKTKDANVEENFSVKEKSPLFKVGKQGLSGSSHLGDHSIETIEHSWRIVPVGERASGFELSGKEKAEHVAPFPEKLIRPYVQSMSPREGIVLDPFLGSGTTMRIAMEEGRNAIGIELNEHSIKGAKKRLNWGSGLDVEYSEAMG